MAFNSYLFFGGNCREAFTRYHEIFGGDLVLLDMNAAPPDARDRRASTRTSSCTRH